MIGPAGTFKAPQPQDGDGAIYAEASRRANPEAYARIQSEVFAILPKERECCGTFAGSHHRKTCPKYRGK